MMAVENGVVKSAVSAQQEQAIACADIAELLSAASSFPTLEFAQGLCSEAFTHDFLTCLFEAGVSDDHLQKAEALGEKLHLRNDAATLLGELKKEYSRLFLAPGKLVVIYPYESAFCFVERGGEGFPSLFINPITADVEAYLRRADALFDDYRKEPADAVFRELDFLRLLYTHIAASLNESASEAGSSAEANNGAELWVEQLRSFKASHIDNWMPRFFRRVKEKTRHEAYAQLSELALLSLESISNIN
jgi:TorA maturation chaperone TorD